MAGWAGYPPACLTARCVPYGPHPPFYGYLTNFGAIRPPWGYTHPHGGLGGKPARVPYGPLRALRPAPAILRLSFQFYEGTKNPTATHPHGAYWGRSLPLWLVF